eukprot:bmy_06414T0
MSHLGPLPTDYLSPFTPPLKPRAPSKGPPPPRPRSGTRVREERRRAGLATGEGSARKCAAPQGSLAPGTGPRTHLPQRRCSHGL